MRGRVLAVAPATVPGVMHNSRKLSEWRAGSDRMKSFQQDELPPRASGYRSDRQYQHPESIVVDVEGGAGC